MVNKNISPKYSYYLGAFGHFLFLIVTSIVFEVTLSKTQLMIPIIFMGLFFMIALAMCIWFAKKQIFFEVDEKHIYYKTLFASNATEIANLKNLRRIGFDFYRIEIGKKSYWFFSSEAGSKLLNDLILNSDRKH